MKYTLEACNIWEQGLREKQEDSIYPGYGKACGSDRLFVLCDGMGGHSSGEVASSTVCQAIGLSVLSRCPDPEGAFTDADFNAVLKDAFDALDTKDNGAAKKMGTTLAFLKLHDKGCTIAHIGDSRVYHIRPGKGEENTEILFHTIDHSLVNDLVKIGELTPEEARHSKQKNVITRAMQPNMERRPKADICNIHDIRPGDYFMLCSDGILEQMEDKNIRYIFSDKGGDMSSKAEMLIKVTNQNHDNHSAIIVHILNVMDCLPEPFEAQLEEKSILDETGDQSDMGGASVISGDFSDDECPESARKKLPVGFCVLRWVIIIAIVAGLGYLVFKFFVPDDDIEKSESIETTNRNSDLNSGHNYSNSEQIVPPSQIDGDAGYASDTSEIIGSESVLDSVDDVDTISLQDTSADNSQLLQRISDDSIKSTKTDISIPVFDRSRQEGLRKSDAQIVNDIMKTDSTGAKGLQNTGISNL